VLVPFSRMHAALPFIRGTDGEKSLRWTVHTRPARICGTSRVCQRERGFQFWDDSRIRPGDEWRRQIREAIATAKVAVLLVSADFLASPFIMGNELPALLPAASDEGAIVLAVIVSPCRYVETETISRFQAANPPSRPLTLMNVHEREEVFYHVSVAVEAALSRIHKAHD